MVLCDYRPMAMTEVQVVLPVNLCPSTTSHLTSEVVLLSELWKEVLRNVD